MLKMSSKDATLHAEQDLIYALQNPETHISLVKLGNDHKEAFGGLRGNIQKSQTPRSTSEVASQRESPRETQISEPRKIPNEKFIPIKTSHWLRTY